MSRKPKRRNATRSAMILVGCAVACLIVVVCGYVLGWIGGAEASKEHPYRWDSADRNLVVVYDGTGGDGCDVRPRHGDPAKIGVPSRATFDLTVADARAEFIGIADVTCDHGRVFTGPVGFVVNFRTSFICPMLVFLVIAANLRRRQRARSGQITPLGGG